MSEEPTFKVKLKCPGLTYGEAAAEEEALRQRIAILMVLSDEVHDLFISDGRFNHAKYLIRRKCGAQYPASLEIVVSVGCDLAREAHRLQSALDDLLASTVKAEKVELNGLYNEQLGGPGASRLDVFSENMHGVSLVVASASARESGADPTQQTVKAAKVR